MFEQLSLFSWAIPPRNRKERRKAATTRKREARKRKPEYDANDVDSYEGHQFTIEELVTLLSRHQDSCDLTKSKEAAKVAMQSPRSNVNMLLNATDKAFLTHAVQSHIELLERGKSAMWEQSLPEERGVGDRLLGILTRRKTADLYPSKTLSQNEFHFLELALSEHADFAAEGAVKSFYKNPGTDGIQVYRIVKKLRNYFRSDVDPDAPNSKPYLLVPEDVGGNNGMEYIAAMLSSNN